MDQTNGYSFFAYVKNSNIGLDYLSILVIFVRFNPKKNSPFLLNKLKLF